MTVTAVMIDQVRRWTAEDSGGSYTDEQIIDIIERYPIMDANGEDPYVDEFDESYDLGSGGSGDQVINPNWSPTFDLHLSAADVWDEKAARNVVKFSFSADGASYNRNEVYKACREEAATQRSLADGDSAAPRKEKTSASDQAEEAFDEWESGEDL